jgi:hypothetical protein
VSSENEPAREVERRLSGLKGISVAPSRVPRLAGSHGERSERVAEKAGFQLAGVAPGSQDPDRSVGNGATRNPLNVPRRQMRHASRSPHAVPRGTFMLCHAEPLQSATRIPLDVPRTTDESAHGGPMREEYPTGISCQENSICRHDSRCRRE